MLTRRRLLAAFAITTVLATAPPVHSVEGTGPGPCPAEDTPSSSSEAAYLARPGECLDSSVGAWPYDDYSDWYKVAVGPVPNRGAYDEVTVELCAAIVEDGDGSQNSEIPLKFRIYFESVQPGYENYPSDPNWNIYEVYQNQCETAIDTRLANQAVDGYWYLEIYRAVLDHESSRGKAQYQFTIA